MIGEWQAVGLESSANLRLWLQKLLTPSCQQQIPTPGLSSHTPFKLNF